MNFIYRIPAFVLLLAWILVPGLVTFAMAIWLPQAGFNLSTSAVEIIITLIFLVLYFGYPVHITVELSRRYDAVSWRLWLPALVSLSLFAALTVVNPLLLAGNVLEGRDLKLYGITVFLIGATSCICLFGCASHAIVLAERERYGTRKNCLPLFFCFLFQLPIGVFFIHPTVRRLLAP